MSAGINRLTLTQALQQRNKLSAVAGWDVCRYCDDEVCVQIQCWNGLFHWSRAAISRLRSKCISSFMKSTGDIVRPQIETAVLLDR